jgi:hypothetical protein
MEDKSLIEKIEELEQKNEELTEEVRYCIEYCIKISRILESVKKTMGNVV